MRLLLDSTSNHSRVHAEKVIICISSAYFRLLMQNRHSVSHIYYTWFVMAKQILLSHVMFRPRSNVLQFDDGYSRRICFGRIELCCYVKRITQVNITMLCFQLFFFVSSYVIWRVFTLLIGTQTHICRLRTSSQNWYGGWSHFEWCYTLLHANYIIKKLSGMSTFAYCDENANDRHTVRHKTLYTDEYLVSCINTIANRMEWMC